MAEPIDDLLVRLQEIDRQVQQSLNNLPDLFSLSAQRAHNREVADLLERFAETVLSIADTYEVLGKED